MSAGQGDRSPDGATQILFATDFSKSAEEAEAAAILLAEAFGARLHFVHVFDNSELPRWSADYHSPAAVQTALEESREQSRGRLEAATASAARKVDCGEPFLGDGPVAAGIAERAAAVDADLVVVGAQGHSRLSHLLIGSVAEATVRQAPCSVLTIRGSLTAPGPVVVGTDFSESATGALREACALADRLHADLHIVHAEALGWRGAPYEPSPANEFYQELFREAQLQLTQVAESCAIAGDVTTELSTLHPQSALNDVGERRGARLIVVGSKGLTGMKRFLLGSVAERTVRHAKISVLVARDKSTDH